MKRIFGWLKDLWCRYDGCDGAMRAGSLTYFTMLGLVPILCVLLCTAKWCGLDRYAHEQLNRYADHVIASVEYGQDAEVMSFMDKFLGDKESRETKRVVAHEFGVKARDAVNELFARIDGFSVGTLGWIGFVCLLWTIVGTISVVETSFNRLLGEAKPRPLWRRIILYLFLVTVVPALAAVAMSLPVMNATKQVIVATLGATWFTRWAGEGLVWFLDSSFLRLTLTFVWATLFFAILFWVIPSRHVRVKSALVGGAATAFAFGAWVKICAVAQVGIARSSALYGSFALLPIVLAWVYVSWQIVLLGFTVTCTVQQRVPVVRRPS